MGYQITDMELKILRKGDLADYWKECPACGNRIFVETENDEGTTYMYHRCEKCDSKLLIVWSLPEAEGVE